MSAEGMIDSDDTQPPAPRRNRVLGALKRAERKVFTRPVPKSAKAQVEFLYTRAKKSTKALAEELGVSPRTVQRYRAGQQTRPQKKLRAALVEETESQWQPQVRARFISTAISPTHASQILQLQEAGPTEEDLHPVVAEAITESYFTEWSTRADGLRADFTHVRSIDFEF
jgi:hypothetical protein